MLVLLVFIGASNKVLASDYRYGNRDRRCTEILVEIAEKNNASENYEKEVNNSDRNYSIRFENMGNKMFHFRPVFMRKICNH